MYNVTNRNTVRTIGRGGNRECRYGVRTTCGPIYEEVDKKVANRPPLGYYDADFPYSVSVNNVFNDTRITCTTVTRKGSRKTGPSGRTEWLVSYAMEWQSGAGPMKISVTEGSCTISDATNRACFMLLKKLKETTFAEKLEHVHAYFESEAHYQMDKEGSQGLMDQESARSQNTIITRDQGDTSSAVVPPKLPCFSSSEPVHDFPEFMDRWAPLKSIKVETTMATGDVIQTYRLPRDLIGKSTVVELPNITPLKTFALMKMNVRLRFVVNGHRMMVGKILVSAKPGGYLMDVIANNLQAQLCRPHVILDLATNCEGELVVPYKYFRPLIKTITTAKPLSNESNFAQVMVTVLSPLSVGANDSSNMEIRGFFKFEDVQLTAMSYRAEPQMDEVIASVMGPRTTAAVKDLIKGAENALSEFGKAPNRDKPTVLHQVCVVPRPRMFFSNQKGLTDCSLMRDDPTALTSFHKVADFTDEPRSWYDLSRIWGMYKEFKWAENILEGQTIADIVISPGCRNLEADYVGSPTPWEYATAHHRFWGGTIETRLDFVSNSFHSGAVMISAEYERSQLNGVADQSFCTYTKTFHLGEQKSVEFTIPYIYDSPIRMTPTVPYGPFSEAASTIDIMRKSYGIVTPILTRLKVRVVNSLHTPVGSPQNINVLLFVRGGEDTTLLDTIPGPGLCIDSRSPNVNWPLASTVQAKIPFLSSTSIYGDTNLKSQLTTVAYTQMEPDPTKDFRPGVSNADYLSSHIGSDFYDTLRRPILIVEAGRLDPASDGFFIPVCPPTRNQPVGPPWNQAIHQSPQVAVTNMFGMWRGSLRYTITLGMTAGEIIYVTYMPFTGVRLCGNMTHPLSGTSHKPHKVGLMTEIICPTVNSTATIEVPFDFPYDWARMARDNPGVDVPWEEMCIENSGHLIIWSSQPKDTMRFDVWVSIGDDFKLGNFLGVPTVKWNQQVYTFRTTDRVANTASSSLAASPAVSRLRSTVEFDGFTPDGQTLELANAISFFETFAISPTNVTKGTLSEQYEWLRKNAPVYIQAQYKPLTLDNKGMPKANVLVTTWNQFEALRTPQVAAIPQMEDFQISNVRTQVSNIASNVSKFAQQGLPNTSKAVSTSLVTAIPVIGPALTMGKLASEVSNVCEDASKTINSMRDNMEHVKEKTGALTEKFGLSIDKITQLVEGVAAKLTTTVSIGANFSELILDILVCWATESWGAVSYSVLKFLCRGVGYDVTSKLYEWATSLGSSISSMFSLSYQSDGMTVLSVLVGIVGTILGCKLNESSYRSFGTNLGIRLTSSSGIQYFLTVMRFIKETFTSFKNVLFAAFGYVDPEVAALKYLSAHSPEIKKFAGDANKVLCEANNAMLVNANYRLWLWQVVIQAYQIRALLAQVPVNAASPHLAKLCGEVIEYGRDHFADISCSPVRYEPFVICISGAPGIGKSFMTERLASELLKHVGLKPRGELIYTRLPGSRFWSGYHDQPVVVYDDSLNLRSLPLVEAELSELYHLKSTCNFTPEMAHLEEKKIRGNPLLVIQNCNDAFPTSTLSIVANFQNAILRRRDVVVHVTRKNPEGSTRDLDPTTITNFEHLQFQFYTDSTLRESLGQDKYEYPEFLSIMQARFEKWHVQETKNVAARVKLVQDNLNGTDTEYLTIKDPFSLFYSYEERAMEDVHQNMMIPSDMLEQAVRDLVPLIRDHQVASYQNDLSPEDLEEICVGSIWGALQSFSAREMFVQLFEKCGSKLAQWALNFSGDVTLIECAVCGDQKVPHGTCQTSSMHASHMVCYECYRGIMESENVCCPTCRAGIRTITVEERGAALCWWISGLFRLGQTVESISSSICRWMKFSRRHFCITKMVELFVNLGLYLNRKIPLSRLVAGTTSVSVDLLNYTTVYQSDVDPVPSTSTEVCDELPHIVGTRWEEVREMHPREHCYHSVLSDQVHSTRYKDGEWTVNFQKCVVQAPDGLCGEKCYWNNKIHQNEFYTGMLSRNMYKYRKALGLARIDPTRYEEVRAVVPLIYRPHWLDDDAVSDELVELNQPWYQRLIDWAYQWKDLIMWALSVSAAAVAIWSGVRLLFPAESVEYDMALYADYNPDDARVPGKRYKHPNLPQKIVRCARFEAEGQSVTNDAKMAVLRNYVTFIISQPTGDRTLHGVGLYGNYCLIPKHYLSALHAADDNGYTVTVEMSNQPARGREVFSMKMVHYQKDNTVDLAMIQLPPSFPLFKDIRKFIATYEDYARPMSTEVSILLPPRAPHYMPTDVEIDLQQNAQYVVKVENDVYDKHDVLQYNFSRRGACGSIIFGPRGPRPILGMHFAGVGEGRNTGYAIILVREHFDHLESKQDIIEFQSAAWQPIEQAKIIPETTVLIEGTISPPSHLPAKSKIRKSKLFGKIPGPYTEPVILAKNDPRYESDKTPLLHGVNKHGKLTTNFPIDDLEDAGEALWNMFYAHMKPNLVHKTPLTLEEAILGFDGVPYYDTMRLNTSSGWPRNCTKRVLKSDYIKLEPKIEIDEELVREHKERTEGRRKGCPANSIFVDTLKDERKLQEKVRKPGATRVFCNPDLEFVLATRKNFLPFAASFYKNRASLGHAVGINTLGSEWSNIANSLVQRNPEGILSLDYSNFGPAFNAGVGQMAANIIVRWTLEHVPGSDEREMRSLLFEAMQSLHLVSNTVYRQTCGSPSGSPLTVIINSLVNQLYILLAWKACTPSKFPWDEFRKRVTMFVYGDDTILAVDKEAMMYFNGESIADYFGAHGVVATDAGKSGTMEYTTIARATFLKRGFERHPYLEMQWLGPLDWRSVVDIANYIWETPDTTAATEVNIMMSLIQAFGHGEKKWMQWYEELRRAARSARVQMPIITWRQLNEVLYNGGQIDELEPLFRSIREEDI